MTQSVEPLSDKVACSNPGTGPYGWSLHVCSMHVCVFSGCSGFLRSLCGPVMDLGGCG